VLDQENSQGQRIGDRVTLSGVGLKLILELSKRYSDVTFRMFIIRSAKGDAPTGNTLWNGASGNKMLDNFNTERFTVLFTKYVKITSPFSGVQPTGLQKVGSGFATGTPTVKWHRVFAQYPVLSRCHLRWYRIFAQYPVFYINFIPTHRPRCVRPGKFTRPAYRRPCYPIRCWL